jgi:hypothetical protein
VLNLEVGRPSALDIAVSAFGEYAAAGRPDDAERWATVAIVLAALQASANQRGSGTVSQDDALWRRPGAGRRNSHEGAAAQEADGG